MIDWSICDAVERDPARVSGAWLFRSTRVPISALFENLESGGSVGFEVFVTTDSRLRYQQNLSARRIAVVCLLSTSWSRIRRVISSIVDAIEAASLGTCSDVQVPHDDG